MSGTKKALQLHVRELARDIGVVVTTRVKTTGKVHFTWRKKVDILEDCRRALAEKHSEVLSGDAEMQITPEPDSTAKRRRCAAAKHIDGAEMKPVDGGSEAAKAPKVLGRDEVRKRAQALCQHVLHSSREAQLAKEGGHP